MASKKDECTCPTCDSLFSGTVAAHARDSTMIPARNASNASNEYIDLAAKKSHYQPCAKVILFDDFFFSGGGLGTTE